VGCLIDTNAASELRKARAAHPHFITWSTRVDRSAMFLSVKHVICTQTLP
jgi:hypothetical protein